MDIKEFAQEFIENVKMAAEMNDADYDQELATNILEYIEDNGEVNAPEICSFQKTRSCYNTEFQLANNYKEYQQLLLEKNMHTFLQFKNDGNPCSFLVAWA